MLRLGSRMATHFDQHMAPLGLTQAQFRLLLSVTQQPGVTPSELAEQLLLDKATISLVSARLINAGLLERRPGPNRRTHALHPTDQGLEKLEAAGPRAIALAHETLADWSPQELDTMLGLLAKLERKVRLK